MEYIAFQLLVFILADCFWDFLKWNRKRREDRAHDDTVEALIEALSWEKFHALETRKVNYCRYCKHNHDEEFTCSKDCLDCAILEEALEVGEL